MEPAATQSLAGVLDSLNDALFHGHDMPAARKQQAALWIAARQGQAGAYRGVLYAPTPDDRKLQVRLFTGETVQSNAGLRCKLGFEAAAMLVRLDVDVPAVRQAMERTYAGMHDRMLPHNELGGTYCCGSCSVAYWRLLAAGGFTRAELRLKAGLEVLRQNRDGQGKWRRFPFYYTLLALSEMDLHNARNELQYAARVCERLLKRKASPGIYGTRRAELVHKVLAQA